MSKKKKERLDIVYSTNPNYSYQFEEEEEQATLAPKDQLLYVSIDRKQRGGKEVTLIEGFVGTDEGEVTQYLGCELIRDRKARTAKLVQSGYAERVLKTFGMWNCKSVSTPLDSNSRLSKSDCPEVIDPVVHHRYRGITGCQSYLVNMTRPDLAFA